MLKYITLREIPDLKEYAADWFHTKWGVPKEAYLDCMDAYLRSVHRRSVPESGNRRKSPEHDSERS